MKKLSLLNFVLGTALIGATPTCVKAEEGAKTKARTTEDIVRDCGDTYLSGAAKLPDVATSTHTQAVQGVAAQHRKLVSQMVLVPALAEEGLFMPVSRLDEKRLIGYYNALACVANVSLETGKPAPSDRHLHGIADCEARKEDLEKEPAVGGVVAGGAAVTNQGFSMAFGAATITQYNVCTAKVDREYGQYLKGPAVTLAKRAIGMSAN